MLLLMVVGFATATSARAADSGWTPQEVEQELMCVVCKQRLDQSDSAFAASMRAKLEEWHEQGLSKQQVLDRMVAQFGPEVLASPPKEGFNLLAWLVPAAVLVIGGGVALALALVWARSRPGGGAAGEGGGLDPSMEARIARELEGLE